MEKQNLNYIGSKYSLLSFIEDTISKYTVLENKTFCDLFGGTNIVGKYFKDKVKNILSNDLEYYSFVLANNYIKNSNIYNLESYIELLNNLEGIKGDFYNNYCENGTSDRLYFSEQNGMKIDAIRQRIEKDKNYNNINEQEFYSVLTALIEASDKVANTTSVYGAYLKKIKKSALKELTLINHDAFIHEKNHKCYNKDANDLVKEISGDILYLDPPYNARQYGSNYHILNTIAKYDLKDFEPKGKTGLRYYNKSNYCYKTKVYDTFEDLIKNAQFKHIFISYSSEGILSKDDFIKILSKYGKVSIEEQDYRTFKSDSKRNNKSESVIEYIFVLEK